MPHHFSVEFSSTLTLQMVDDLVGEDAVPASLLPIGPEGEFDTDKLEFNLLRRQQNLSSLEHESVANERVKC